MSPVIYFLNVYRDSQQVPLFINDDPCCVSLLKPAVRVGVYCCIPSHSLLEQWREVIKTFQGVRFAE